MDPISPLSSPAFMNMAETMETRATSADGTKQVFAPHIIATTCLVQDAGRRSMGENYIDFGMIRYGILGKLVEAVLVPEIGESKVAELWLVR